MRKIIYISVWLVGSLSVAEAQKKFVYEDTSLILKQDQISAPAEDTRVIESTTAYNEDSYTGDDELIADTILNKNNLSLPFDSVKNWKNLKAYAYTRYLDSLLKNKKNDTESGSDSTRRSRGPGFLNSLLGSGILRVLLWTLAIVFIGFVIYRLFLTDVIFRRISKTGKDVEEIPEEETITPESDFDALIRQALQNKNYRQAVRYQYLRTLHALAGKDLIVLSPDKTNFQYVHEIKDQHHRQDFASLTLNYEYVWYGEFEIDQTIYQKIETGFTGLNQKL